LNSKETINDFIENGRLDIERVINKYNNYIYTILKNAMSNSEDIEETLSDVFVILWKNYLKIDKSTDIRLYMLGVTKNLIKKRYRDYNLNCIVEDINDYENKIDSCINIEKLAEQNEKSKILIDIVESMKEEEKNIFVMFYYNSVKIKEISSILNISQTNIKVKLHRLRKIVKKEFKERGYNYGK